MFIVRFKDGTQLTGDKITWDDVPSDSANHVTGLMLTLPFKGNIKNMETGEFTPMPARTISLGTFNRYYAAKEAVAGLGDRAGAEANVVAEVMGGIDDRAGIVVEVRVGKDGNISMQHFPVEEIRYAPHVLKTGRPVKKVV